MTKKLSAKYFGFAADKHCSNHAGEHWWYKKIEGGFTECCEYDNECEKHLRMRKEDMQTRGGSGGHYDI